tara:strand:- start:3733 stop:4260 length:528 start_codon:yes stop_codon:yes gene_type:complete
MSNFRKTYMTVSFIAVFMFFFSYMLVPLYDIFCEITGLNGKTNQERIVQLEEKSTNRFVTIKFTSTVAGAEPFNFDPIDREMVVEVGKLYTTSYVLTNNSKVKKQVTASPSVVPGADAEYFKKIECFCFTQQEIHGLETKELPLQFIIDDELPDDTKTLILSYTMFNTTGQMGSN